MRSCLLLLLSVILPSSIIHCLPEQTKWPDQPIDFKSSANTQAFLHAVLANDTKVKPFPSRFDRLALFSFEAFRII